MDVCLVGGGVGCIYVYGVGVGVKLISVNSVF